MEELVFKLVKELYPIFNGDPVTITRAVYGSEDEIAKYFSEYDISVIEDAFAMLGISREEVKDVNQSWCIEYYVHACKHGMTLEEYNAAGFGEEIESINEMRRDWNIDKDAPLDADRIENLIRYLRDRVGDECTRILLECWTSYDKQEDSKLAQFTPERVATLEEALAICWCTPTDVADWLEENQLSVEDVISCTGPDSRDGSLAECISEMERNCQQSMKKLYELAYASPEDIKSGSTLEMAIRNRLVEKEQTNSNLGQSIQE